MIRKTCDTGDDILVYRLDRKKFIQKKTRIRLIGRDKKMNKVVNGQLVNIDNIELFEKAIEHRMSIHSYG